MTRSRGEPDWNKGFRAPAISVELAMGVSLEAIRTRQSMGVGQLSAETGIPLDLLLAYEAGTCRAEARHVAALARALDVPVSALFAAALRPSY